MLKKYLYVFLVLVCLLTVVSCKDKDDDSGNGSGSENPPVKCVHEISLYEDYKYKCQKCNVEFRSIYFENVEKFEEEENKVVYDEVLNQYYIVEDENVIMFDVLKEQYYMYDVYNESPTIPTPVKGNLSFLYWQIVSINGVDVDSDTMDVDKMFDPSVDKLTDCLVLKAIFAGDNGSYPEQPDHPEQPDQPENPDNEVFKYQYDNATFTINVEGKDVQEVSDLLPGMGHGETVITVPTTTYKVRGDKIYSCSGADDQQLETYIEFVKENNEITGAKVSIVFNGAQLGENTVTDSAELEIYKNALNGNFIYFNDYLFPLIKHTGSTNGNEVRLKEVLLEEFKKVPGEDYELKDLDINTYTIITENGKPVKYELDYVAYLEYTFFYPEYKDVTIYITKYYKVTIDFSNVGTTVIE